MHMHIHMHNYMHTHMQHAFSLAVPELPGFATSALATLWMCP
jgi:hypothetical protein